jgi:hypothetical protein
MPSNLYIRVDYSFACTSPGTEEDPGFDISGVGKVYYKIPISECIEAALPGGSEEIRYAEGPISWPAYPIPDTCCELHIAPVEIPFPGSRGVVLKCSEEGGAADVDGENSGLLGLGTVFFLQAQDECFAFSVTPFGGLRDLASSPICECENLDETAPHSPDGGLLPGGGDHAYYNGPTITYGLDTTHQPDCPCNNVFTAESMHTLICNKPAPGEVVIEPFVPGGAPIGPVVKAPVPSQTPVTGPGTELKKLLVRFGVQPTKGCECNSRMRQMNRWGVAGCLEHRSEIVGWMDSEFVRLGWVERIRVGVAAARSGLFGPAAVFDPVGALVDKAIAAAGASNPTRP